MASAIWLRQELPMQMKSTLNFRGSAGAEGISVAALDEVEKTLVNRGVASQLGMKRRGHGAALLDEHRMAVALGKNGDAAADRFDDGRADENHFERLGAKFGGQEENIARKLTAIGIAHDGDVHQPERVLFRPFHMTRKENRAGAGAEKRAAFGGHFANCGVEAGFGEKFHVRGAFAARKNQATTFGEIVGGAHEDMLDAEALEHFRVRVKITLQSEYPDFHFC